MIEGYEKGDVLIDTHVLIWATLEPERLSPTARTVLESARYRIRVSPICNWEMVIQSQAGKWTFKDPANLAVRMASTLDAQWLGIEPDDILCLSFLPQLHKDPFDRMLLAQAVSRSIPLVTADKDLHRYGGFDTNWLPEQRPKLVW